MTFLVTPFEGQHLADFELSSRQISQALAWQLLGQAYTIWCGPPIAVFGLVEDEVGTAWGYVSPRAREHPIAFTRLARRLLRRAAESAGVNRVQCVVATDDGGVCERFARLMGFDYWYTVPGIERDEHEMKGMHLWHG